MRRGEGKTTVSLGRCTGGRARTSGVRGERDDGLWTDVVPEPSRISSYGHELLVLVSLVGLVLDPECLSDRHGDRGGDEAEVVVVQERERLGTRVDDPPSRKTESEKECRPGWGTGNMIA